MFKKPIFCLAAFSLLGALSITVPVSQNYNSISYAQEDTPGVTLKYRKVNYWAETIHENGTLAVKFYMQLDCVIKNESESTLENGWKVELPLTYEQASVRDYWNCSLGDATDGPIVIKDVSWNRNINSGQEASCGMIVCVKEFSIIEGFSSEYTQKPDQSSY